MNPGIIFATNNDNKAREVREILKDYPFKIMSLKDAGIDIDIEETGTTYEENAYIKAKTIFDIVGDKIVIADDSGMEVRALNNEPGVYSARYMGEETPYKIKMENILERMEKYPDDKDRAMTYNCAVTCFIPAGVFGNKEVITFTDLAVVEGIVSETITGNKGFSYDSIFYYPPDGCTMGEMETSKKNSLSHRGKAMRMVAGKLMFYLTEHNKKLAANYPWVIPRNRNSDKVVSNYDYSYTELDQLPIGWNRAFGIAMCEDIQKVLNKHRCTESFRILKIKEKYGSLRLYFTVDSKEAYKEINEIIEKYTDISIKTCIICGDEAQWVSQDWISPYCEKCMSGNIKKAGKQGTQEKFTNINEFLRKGYNDGI